MTARGSQESELPKDFRGRQLSIDFAGPIRPRTKAGNCYFLLAVENHTGKIMIWAMKSALEQNVVNCLREWLAERTVRTVKEWFAKNKELGDWDTKIAECLIDLNRSAVSHNCRKEGEGLDATAGVKENLKFQVGDQVIITRRRKVGRFNEGLGTVDTVKSITGTNTVGLENNGIQSNRDLIKK